MNKFSASFAMLAMFGIFAGCASTTPKEQEPAKVETGKPAMTEVEPVKPPPPVEPKVTPIEVKPIVANPLKDAGSILSKRSVFYEYDSNVVKDEFKPLVTAHSQYLTQNRNRKIVIQGNTDERGSREYNISLGQRRADSVKQMMLLLGVQEAQIETVSFGEEKPRSTGTDEAALAENRRSDIVYDGE
jgi:peptidoglycan-associated lipoprotein